jgi:deazaflavin-dependent oxidoreductase (nitroreductase family)
LTRAAGSASVARTHYADANVFQRMVRRLAATAPGAWLLARTLDHADRWVHRLTRGRHMLSSLLSGLPVVMLTTTGARTGRPRTVPVLGLPAAGGLAVVASNYGARTHPSWYFNLRADPSATVRVSGVSHRVRAVEADGERRARIVRDGLLIYPGWTHYERRAANRRIAIFVLEPIAAAAPQE